MTSRALDPGNFQRYRCCYRYSDLDNIYKHRELIKMVCQSSAIGACDEKTYKHSEGVKFFYLRNLKDDIKRAWKRKILETRKDQNVIGDHVAICSRHFVDGDKRNLPTIISRIVNGDVIWPNQIPSRRIISKKQLDFGQFKVLETPSPKSSETITRSPPFSEKVRRLHASSAKIPAKEVLHRLIYLF